MEPADRHAAPAAAFRVLKRRLVTDQTIEPTQVAGFNQFFDDDEASDSWRWGVGVDQKFTRDVHAGAEFSWDGSDVPFTQATDTGTVVELAKWREELGRAYLYWTPTYWLALGAEYRCDSVSTATTRRSTRASWTRGHIASRSACRSSTLPVSGDVCRGPINQRGTFVGSTGETQPGADQFWTVDLSLGYRLPKRWGLLTFEVRTSSTSGSDTRTPTLPTRRSIRSG